MTQWLVSKKCLLSVPELIVLRSRVKLGLSFDFVAIGYFAHRLRYF